MNEQEIKELAESMGVSVADLMCLARSVANSMIKDKVADTFFDVSEENQTMMTESYVIFAVKKFEQFALTIQTNPEAKLAFNDRIADLLNQ